MNAVGPILRVLRLGHGLTQTHLGSALNLDRSYRARAEHGQRNPSGKVVAAGVEACGVPVMPGVAVVGDLATLRVGKRPLSVDGFEGDAASDWIICALLAADTIGKPDIRARWVGDCAMAWRFPAASRLSDDLRGDEGAGTDGCKS